MINKQLTKQLNQLATANFTTNESVLKNGLVVHRIYFFNEDIRQDLINNPNNYDYYYQQALEIHDNEDDLIRALIDGYVQVYLKQEQLRKPGNDYYEYQVPIMVYPQVLRKHVATKEESISYILEQARIQNIKESQEKLDSYYKNATKQLKTASKNVSTIKSKISAKKLELSALLSERDRLSNDNTGSYAERLRRQEQLRNINSQIPHLTDDINSLETKLQEAQEPLKTIQHDLTVMDKYKSNPTLSFPYVDYQQYE